MSVSSVDETRVEHDGKSYAGAALFADISHDVKVDSAKIPVVWTRHESGDLYAKTDVESVAIAGSVVVATHPLSCD